MKDKKRKEGRKDAYSSFFSPPPAPAAHRSPPPPSRARCAKQCQMEAREAEGSCAICPARRHLQAGLSLVQTVISPLLPSTPSASLLPCFPLFLPLLMSLPLPLFAAYWTLPHQYSHFHPSFHPLLLILLCDFILFPFVVIIVVASCLYSSRSLFFSSSSPRLHQKISLQGMNKIIIHFFVTRTQCRGGRGLDLGDLGTQLIHGLGMIPL